MFAPVLAEYFAAHLVPRFPTLMAAGGCAAVGVISFTVGVILDVIVKKNKQDFIIRLNILSSQRRAEKERNDLLNGT